MCQFSSMWETVEAKLKVAYAPFIVTDVLNCGSIEVFLMAIDCYTYLRDYCLQEIFQENKSVPN